jgi:peptidoglycan/LPS O-acetylase OafA/YrhL
VVIFFVLSGYLVGGRLIQRLMQGTFSLRSYALDRATRILIPFFPALALTAICVFLVHREFPPGFLGQLACNITQLQGIACSPLEGNPSLWSLNYEVWFYVVGGLLAAFFRAVSRTKPGTWFIFLQGALLLAGFWALSLLESVYFFAWIIGAIAAIRPVTLFGIQSVTVNLAGLMIGVGLSQFGGHETDGAHGGLLYIFGTLIVSVFAASLLPWIISVKPGTTISGLLLGLGPPLAAYSYTLYLTHYPLLYWMRTWHVPFDSFSVISLLAYGLKVLACLLAAWLLYLPFERNTSAIRRWLIASKALFSTQKFSS